MLKDRAYALKLLEQLMNEIGDLRKKPILGEEFISWYRDTTKVIQSIFGEDSEEIKDFKKVRLRVPEPVEKFREKTEEFAEEEMMKFKHLDQHWYDERLSELYELILQMTLKLKKNRTRESNEKSRPY